MASGSEAQDRVAALWRRFAKRESVNRSPLYRELAARVALAAEAPAGATLVVFHTATLAYVLDADEREQFGRTVASLGAVWVANEGAGVVPGVPASVAGERSDDSFLICVDRRPLAWCDSHGTWVRWR